MATQVNNGAGFEYCCADSLLTRYRSTGHNLTLDAPSVTAFDTRRERYQQVLPTIAVQQRSAAKALAKFITESNQSWAKSIYSHKTAYKLRVGDDSRNKDVRDLLIYNSKGVQLGISLKWNSEEIKSLRLGDKWFEQFNVPRSCSWSERVQPLHNQLCKFPLWADARAALGKEHIFDTYREAVIETLQLGVGQQGFIENFAQFLFGKQDYLKAMAIAKGKELSLAYYDSSKLPTRIREICPSERGPSYFEVAFDRGWTLLFRLHNKDSKIKAANVGSGMSLTVTVTGWGEKSGQHIWTVPDED